MGTKILAAVEFVEQGGKRAVVCRTEGVVKALMGGRLIWVICICLFLCVFWRTGCWWIFSGVSISYQSVKMCGRRQMRSCIILNMWSGFRSNWGTR